MQHPVDDPPTPGDPTRPGQARPDPTVAGDGDGDGTAALAAAAGMHLLSAGVPLTLLLDLGMPVDSAAIAADEGGSAGWMLA